MNQASPAPRLRLSFTWLGLMPFVIFVMLFMVLPTMHIVIGAFQTRDGAFTLQNIVDLNSGTIPSSYWISVKISVASAALGCLIGFGMAAAVVFGAVPRWVRSPLMTFSGVASNFAGVPLAFAFLATFGPVGLVTVFLRNNFGLVLQRDLGFNILSFWGLTVTYLFFQIPLMILIITPALEGLRREWREAAQVLGATTLQYWRMVAMPILFPSLLGTFALLFANAFGAVATAIALTGSSLNIVPIQLYAQIRGDVLGNPHLGYAMAFGMIVVTAIANVVYIWLRIRAERWLK
ncbi:MAG: ABC transporter permease subunit [Alphaproteobacteria bacterium]|uniref:Acriflavin resistance protein n=1 Tax=Pseudorhizobium pelagicum TaxID=1509405 RepID=A0A922P057_9HYPH|nr:ABC transporter permease subunit [Pseudorhizobium pelagicum]MBU1315170.1 ABC transporter permease subunit [Alphaproteobacteria bacterium]KEQ05078.1 acriflavin resistance protein [Pseudorhizobium pelagicum]KEQ07591.1 acriflavin resistance protein [Pseudorhizobium pelagicum]MBU1550501.1 ABC transporter permease subunit [Alphaproteobacteria bacterium]MBU2338637.1 ABC transporter permease subunit [Alphaproteobacteria bacterium]|tara:strand:+ start:2801 stop:3676 length:876 start_codon:yes stop_codon:yes gene_type:complete